MAFVPSNPDVGTLMEPGVFTSFNFTGAGAAITNTNKSAHLLAYRSGGAGTADTPTLYTQQSDVNSDHGQGSEIARLFAAFQSQNGPTGEVWCTGITPVSGGTAATFVLTFAGPATATGSIWISVCGYVIAVTVAIGDTATIVATALYGMRQALLDSPVSVTDSGSGTLTFTYRHKGVTGEDCPIVYHQDGATGITASNATVTYTSNPSGSAGSATVTVGGFTYTAAIDPAVETTATLVATKVYNAINNASPPGPVFATNPSGGVVLLFPRNDRPLRRVTAAIVTVATTTVAVTLNGTAGASTMTGVLTAALTNAAALVRGFAAWVTSLTDTVSLGALQTHLEGEGNGVVQKNQCLFIASTAKLATAGAVITGASPSPTAMLNSGCTLLWVKDAPQQGFELAARYAAAYMQSDYFPQNLDGVRLTTRGSVPLATPHLIDRPNRADRESAMATYYMTVGMVDGAGYLTIERAVTTSNASNQDLHDLSTVRQIHTARPDLNQYLVDRFSKKSLRINGVPKTSNTVTLTSVRDAVFVWTMTLDDQDRFDGADVWKSAIVCSPDPVIASRLRISVPYALIRPLHQVTPVIQPV